MATHAIINAEYPELSYLLFASSNDSMEHDEALYAHEIEKLDLEGVSLVVLAACDTGNGRANRSRGALSLAQSFLVAGVSSVVASLWPIEDIEATDFLEAFHRRVAVGEAPSSALRQVQLDCATKALPGCELSTWAGLQVYEN